MTEHVLDPLVVGVYAHVIYGEACDAADGRTAVVSAHVLEPGAVKASHFFDRVVVLSDDSASPCVSSSSERANTRSVRVVGLYDVPHDVSQCVVVSSGQQRRCFEG